MSPRTRRPVLLLAALAALALGLSGCGGGGGGDQLILSVAETRARFQVVELATGTVTPLGEVPDLLTNPEYRSTKMVFHLIGQPSPFYIAVFETTQAQWQAMTGAAPWLQLVSTVSASDVRVGSDYPAIGISLSAAKTALAGYATIAHSAFGARYVMRLPSDAEWSYACAGGTSSAYSWGGTPTAALASAHARVYETAGGIRGAGTVAGLEPNGYGLYDMHGNVWELTAESHIRGGSWNDPVSLATTSNSGDILPDTAHLLVGLRLVYMP